MTKLELSMTNNELEARVIELQMQLRVKDEELTELEDKLARKEELLHEGEQEMLVLEREVEAGHESHEAMCRRCYRAFSTSNGDVYCSRDCEHFTRQAPFSVLWEQLHPAGHKEPVLAFAAKM